MSGPHSLRCTLKTYLTRIVCSLWRCDDFGGILSDVRGIRGRIVVLECLRSCVRPMPLEMHSGDLPGEDGQQLVGVQLRKGIPLGCTWDEGQDRGT